jgi:hypothetical protein
MVAIFLTVCGAVLMLTGTVMLTVCVAGRPGGFGCESLGRAGRTKGDRQLLDLYFIVAVLLPLLGGAVMLAMGLKAWL